MVNFKLKRNKRGLINSVQQIILNSIECQLKRRVDGTVELIIWKAIDISFREENEKIHSSIHVHISDKFQA